MQIEIPELTPVQFGQLVHQLASAASIPGGAAEQIVALKCMAEGLASGALTIAPAN